MKKDETYNGYKNYETWNVALWINNTEHLYRQLVEYDKRCLDHGWKPTYTGLIRFMRLTHDRTGDDVSYSNKKISRKELTEILFEGLRHD